MQPEEYLISKGWYFKRRGEEAIMNCPFCGDKEKKFAVNLISGAYNCLHLNNCGVKGSFYDLQKQMGDRPEKPNLQRRVVMPTKKRYSKPTEKIEGISTEVLEYLKQRGLSERIIKCFRVGGEGDILKLPFYKNGELVNIKSRSIKDKKSMWQTKNAEPVLFNRDNIDTEYLLICEGEIDAMSMGEYGFSAVSVPSGASGHQWVETEWDYLETFRKIIICFDNDQAGLEGAISLSNRLGPWRCFLCVPPMKDINECLLHGVEGSVIEACIENAKEMSPETLVTPEFFTAKVQKLFSMGDQLFGVPTAWHELTMILKGWRGGEVTIWTGKNGSGKSTLLNQHFIDLAVKKVKTCIYSGEMPPERYLRWAVMQAVEKDQPDDMLVAVTLEWMTGRIYIINSTDIITPESLLSDFSYAAKRYGVQHFIIDSLMKVRVAIQDEYRAQADFVSMLCDFAKEYNAHVHLVAHPRKTATDRDEPGKVDVKGSSHITDLADNVIVVYRTGDEIKEALLEKGRTPSDAQLYVKKNREFGVEGRVHLWFNDEIKKFTTRRGI